MQEVLKYPGNAASESQPAQVRATEAISRGRQTGVHSSINIRIHSDTGDVVKQDPDIWWRCECCLNLMRKLGASRISIQSGNQEVNMNCMLTLPHCPLISSVIASLCKPQSFKNMKPILKELIWQKDLHSIRTPESHSCSWQRHVLFIFLPFKKAQYATKQHPQD